MDYYTGFEYLLIDAANQYGLDKKLFEERIQWARDNLDVLETHTNDADCPALYLKAVQAIRKAQQGIPTGHLVGFDAVCSGIQLMSVLTGCHVSAAATGLVHPNVRSDAYTACTNTMRTVLGDGFDISREDAKSALMKSFYGSTKVPKELFGEDTIELDAFYKAAEATAPGAWILLQELLGSWQPWATKHEWQMPDGFNVVCKVMQTTEIRVEVDELDHASFTYAWEENKGSKTGLSLAANSIHSVDSYVARTLHRRLNYDEKVLAYASKLIEIELLERSLGVAVEGIEDASVKYYVDLYEANKMADVVILPYLTAESIWMVSDTQLKGLNHICSMMEKYKPFELISIHDDFKCLANNVNHLRFMYKEVLAELAESEVLSNIMRTINHCQGTYKKLSNNLGEVIRGSNYALT